MILELLGHCPSKKNQWHPKKGGGIRLDSSAKASIDALITQAQYLWRLKLGREPVEHPDMRVTFYARNAGSDRDNKLSTILDVLQKAGVLVNDNIRRFNGTVTLLPAVVAEEEKVVIEIE